MKTAAIGFLLLACLGTGFFAGYLVNRSTDASTTKASALQPQPTAQSRIAVVEPNSSSSDDILSLDVSKPRFQYDQIDRQLSVFDQLKYAHELADQATREELEDYVLKSVSRTDPLYSFNLASIFLEKYTAIDPLAAIDFVETTPRVPNDRFIPHVVTSWVRFDPEGAIDYYKSVENLRLKNVLAGRLLSDPTLKANGFADEIAKSLGARGAAMASALGTNQLPPPMALEEALRLDTRGRMSAVQNALIRWLREDPEAAINRISQHENYEQRTQMFQSILHEYVSIDEDAGFAFAQQYLKGTVQVEQHTLAMLGQINPQKALPLVEDFIARTGNANPLNNIISTWVQKEPIAALAYIDTLPAGQRKAMVRSAAYSYVNSHPQEGFEWLIRQQEDYPQIVRSTISSAINHNTLDIAQRYISRTNDVQTKTALIVGIGNYKASQSPNGALDWLEQYRSETGYSAAVQNIISSMAHQNPRGAADALTNRLDDKSATPIAGQIAANWYRANPTDAMGWINGLDSSEAKSNALSSVVMMVVEQDKDRAIEIARSLPQGRYQDNAKRNVAYGLIAQAPEEVEDIIAELALTGQEADQIRQMAEHRNKIKLGRGP